jgi:hypothetical protein
VGLVIGFLVWVTLRTMKKRTKLLNVEGRWYQPTKLLQHIPARPRTASLGMLRSNVLSKRVHNEKVPFLRWRNPRRGHKV